jgi:hypothetical protein
MNGVIGPIIRLGSRILILSPVAMATAEMSKNKPFLEKKPIFGLKTSDRKGEEDDLD